ncbi:MAG: HIT family protein [Gemmatimonadota bacterium]
MSERREACVFCDIVRGTVPATIVLEDGLVIALLDLRQANPGHVLVIPREHIPDIRSASDAIAAVINVTVARVARAVSSVFPNDGLSIWHSIGEGGNQEVPHLHYHVHPRLIGDGLLDVYPTPPALPPRETLEQWGATLRERLAKGVD